MKKTLVLTLCIILSLSFVIAGCSQKAEKGSEDVGENTGKQSEDNVDQSKSESSDDGSIVTPAGTFPIVKEKVTLTILTAQSPQVEDYETNKMTKYMEEKTNVHINWELVPQKDAGTKVNLLLASNTDLPNVIMGINMGNEMLMKYGSQGVFLPFNDYIDKYGIEFKKVMEYPGFENIRQQITAPDGNIYALPKISESYNGKWSQKMWINKRFLSNLGLDMPETTEDFYKVLKAFKGQDPNGNGKNDEIPLVGATTGWRTYIDGFIMCAFIYNDGGDRVIVNDGKIDVVYNKPEWRDGLAYMHKLCVEGLLDPVSFTQDRAQLKQLGENPEAAILGAVTAGCTNDFTNAKGERRLEYTTVPPLKGPKGVQLTGYYPPKPNNIFVITNTCKYPEVAYRWADWLYSEEASIRSRFGEPEVDWRKPKEGELGVNGKPAYLIPILQWGSVQNSHWQFNNPGFTPDKLQSGQGFEQNDPTNTERIFYVETEKNYDGYEPDHDMILPPLFFTEEEASEYSELKTIINEYVKESIARFTTGDLDVEKDWDKYLKELENMGLKRYIEIIQTAYDRQYGGK